MIAELYLPERNGEAMGIRIPTHPKDFPRFERELINPPEQHQQYNPLPYEESVQLVLESELPEGRKMPLLGLLKYGGVVEFPGGVGLDYITPFKVNYKPEYVVPAAEMLGPVIRFSRANLVIAPDIAPLFFARDLSRSVGERDLLRLLKDGKHANGYGFSVPSYTKGAGNDDILYFNSSALQDELDDVIARGQRELVATIAEDIIDTGQMIIGAKETEMRMREDGIPIRIVGAVVIVEKVYTQAADKIRDKYGMYVMSAVQVEDLWRTDDYKRQGIKVTGIDRGLSFRKQPLERAA